MTILGLIVEYNPFHHGHLYHLQTAKSLTQPAATIAVMSGCFTQRGEPAIIDKWSRAAMALAAGVDLVLELPVAWATQSAPNFASGAVRLLAAAGASDICFGSEVGKLGPLATIADLLLTEPAVYQQELQASLQQGHSFASAQGKAIGAAAPNLQPDIFNQPNNTLAIQYLAAIKQYDLPLRAHTLTRTGSYHDLATEQAILSATAIRRHLLATSNLRGMPPSAAANLNKNIALGRGPVSWQDLAPYLFYNLRTQTQAQMLDWPESGEGLGDRLWHAARQTNDWQELLRNVKTRRFPLTRLQRLCTYILLRLSSERLAQIDLAQEPPYLRVLALNRNSLPIRNLLKNSRLPIIYAAADAPCGPERLRHCLDQDILASDIYTLAWTAKSRAGLDYTQALVTN